MLVLASASPRRRELLAAAGIRFDVLAVDVDERPLDDEAPRAHVMRLAIQKASVAAEKRPDATVLGADTVVVLGDRILGKPTDRSEAAAMLRELSGRAHEVLTGVAIIVPGSTSSPFVDVACTEVTFRQLADEEIRAYAETGEPMDKAGAYAIQGRAARFVERLDGSYTNVVGLPVGLVCRMLFGTGSAGGTAPR